MLNESTPGWCAKASNLGVLSNRAREPRKPAPLGNILKNSAKRKSSVISLNDVVQNPEQQPRKKNSKEKSNSPDGSSHLAHTTESLR